MEHLSEGWLSDNSCQYGLYVASIVTILFYFYFYFFPAKVWMQEVAHEYQAKTRGMSEEKKKELQNNLLETFGHLLEIDQMAVSGFKVEDCQQISAQDCGSDFLLLF